MTHLAPLEGPPFCILQPAKKKSHTLADAVIAGCGGLGQKHLGEIEIGAIPKHVTPVIIGVFCVQTMKALHASRRPFVQVDNGYLRGYKEGGYFRATSNAFQWIARTSSQRGRRTGLAEGPERFKALDLPLAPWRGFNGKNILVALQSGFWFREVVGMTAEAWTEQTKRDIAACTDRDIVVRIKPQTIKGVDTNPTPLEDDLDDARCVVAHSSAVLLKAALAGIPVFPTAACAASPLQAGSFSHPAEPTRRLGVFQDLAANQWTLDEFRSGRMWRDLQTHYEPEFLPIQ